MGIVYRAKDTTLDRDVALKMMDAGLARDESFLKRFQSEAKALARLQNPNIVSIFALRETEIGFCIVMEFVEGNTLADRIRDGGTMPFSKAFPIFKQLLTALDHAHKLGIIHRDIKPSNVMLTSTDVVKVTDFGLAKIQQVSSATMTLGTGGTLYYMSPEQIRGLSHVDHRGDIYSLGMTLYETLTGKVPFSDSETDFSIRQAIVEGKIPSPDKMNSDLPRDLIKVIMKSIEKDPEKRYQSAADMLDALEQVAQKAKQKKGAPARREPVVRTQGKSRFPLVLGGAVLVAAVVVGYLLYGGRTVVPTRISVTTQPVGAEVTLDGVHLGTAPIEGQDVKSGSRLLHVSQSGYLPKDTTVTITDGQDLALVVALSKEARAIQPLQQPSESRTNSGESREREHVDTRPPEKKPVVNTEAVGTLLLNVVPNGNITIDGGKTYSGVKRAQRIEVSAGERTITFENPRFGSTTQKILVEQGQTKELTCYFERYVSIGVSGQSNWGTIMVDGKRATIDVNGEPVLATAPLARLPLSVGKHKVLVTREGFATVGGAREIDVKPGFDTDIVSRLVFDLKKN
jgi:eukaryotic-like serine/threonine-protein kinase